MPKLDRVLGTIKSYLLFSLFIVTINKIEFIIATIQKISRSIQEKKLETKFISGLSKSSIKNTINVPASIIDI